MRPAFKNKFKLHADKLGIDPESMCVRLAKKLGTQRRIIVRTFGGGGLRIVQPGENLKLKKDEFIANVPRTMIEVALKEIDAKGEIKETDLDD